MKLSAFKSRRILMFLMLFLILMSFVKTLLYISTLSDLSETSKVVLRSGQPLSTNELKIAELTSKYKINWTCTIDKEGTPWQLAESWLTFRQITSEDSSSQLGCVLNALRKDKITHADVGSKGTQLKITLTLEGGQRVVFKPKFYDRDYVMVGTPYAGKDRHNAEVAAFHVNRIIGLNKAPLVVGRTVCLESEIRPVAHKNLLKTFYYESGNSCFYGKCYYCKGKETGVCADRTELEGSVTLWLPESYNLGEVIPHPWARTYSPKRSAKWETNPDHCVTVMNTRPYETPPRLLDLIDIAVFDFIISNADRHHYETFEYSKDSTVVALDNGKSFGNPYVDETSILAPLYQCCILRSRTYKRLLDLRNGVLSQVLYNVLLDEPLAPVLTPTNYKAIDRRLDTVITTISECIEKRGAEDVIQDDGY